MTLAVAVAGEDGNRQRATASAQLATEVDADRLADLVRRHLPGSLGIAGLVRLSGGASQETWAFDIIATAGTRPMILRRTPPGYRRQPQALTLVDEAELFRLAGAAGVPSPQVRFVVAGDAVLGEAIVMDRIEGETLPRRIFRDPAMAGVRPRLARRCGEILGLIHGIERSKLPPLPELDRAAELRSMRAAYEADGTPRPVFDLALRWLADHAPPSSPSRTLVHGDFRAGNLIIGPDGIRAVLDWELAHFGDPIEDLGWICVNSWRFGEIDKPVGGFGSVEELIAGYRGVRGVSVDAAAVRYWEVLGTLRWGIICLGMFERFRAGERTPERAMIARRASEAELDILRLLAPRR